MNDLDRRVTELEIKLSFSDDLLETLNELVARQQAQIQALQLEVLTLRQQSRDQGPAQANAEADRPPHY